MRWLIRDPVSRPQRVTAAIQRSLGSVRKGQSQGENAEEGSSKCHHQLKSMFKVAKSMQKQSPRDHTYLILGQ